MNEMHGIIFAYSSRVRLRELTEHRTAASIPFGGRYRVIDFMLSSLVNAGVNDVGVIMHESYQSLLDHLGSGKDWDLSRKRGGLRILPPFGYAGARKDTFFRGRMEALFGVTSYISRIRQQYVVLADGDLVANIPIDRVYEEHLRSGADITCVCCEQGLNADSNSAFVSYDKTGRVTEVLMGERRERTAECVGVYILSKTLLESLTAHCAAHNLYSFLRDVLQHMVDRLNIRVSLFDGYCCKLGSIAGYFRHSMDLLNKDVRAELFNRERPIKTKVRDEAPTYYGPGGTIKNSLVADGCYIEGTVENCILFRGVRVERGATVQNSILMQDTCVNSDALLNFAIADKEVAINRGRMLMGHETYPIAISKGSTV